MTPTYHHKHHASPPLDWVGLDRDIARLHELGVCSTSEFILEFAARIGGVPALFSTLAEFERLTPAAIRVAGGHNFPPRPLHAVPQHEGDGR